MNVLDCAAIWLQADTAMLKPDLDRVVLAQSAEARCPHDVSCKAAHTSVRGMFLSSQGKMDTPI